MLMVRSLGVRRVFHQMACEKFMIRSPPLKKIEVTRGNRDEQDHKQRTLWLSHKRHVKLDVPGVKKTQGGLELRHTWERRA